MRLKLGSVDRITDIFTLANLSSDVLRNDRQSKKPPHEGGDWEAISVVVQSSDFFLTPMFFSFRSTKAIKIQGIIFNELGDESILNEIDMTPLEEIFKTRAQDRAEKTFGQKLQETRRVAVRHTSTPIVWELLRSRYGK